MSGKRAPPPTNPSSAERRRVRGAKARRSGRAAEIVAAFWLMLHGWRILGLRLKTPGAEVDLLARRGRILAVVEIKTRARLDDALAAVGADQRRRLRQAGARLAARRALEGLSVRLDLVALAPGRLPRHIADAWPQG